MYSQKGAFQEDAFQKGSFQKDTFQKTLLRKLKIDKIPKKLHLFSFQLAYLFYHMYSQIGPFQGHAF